MHSHLPLQLLEEMLRFRTAQRLKRHLDVTCQSLLPGEDEDGKGLLPAAIFEGCRAAAAQGTDSSSVRSSVHAVIDVRRQAKVVRVETEAEGTVTGAPSPATAGSQVFHMSHIVYEQGDILGVLRDAETGVVSAPTPLQGLRLAEPESAYYDPLVPALEFIEPHRASRSLFDLLLRKLCGTVHKMETSYNAKRRRAWGACDDTTYVFYTERKRLWELKETLRACEKLPTVQAHIVGHALASVLSNELSPTLLLTLELRVSDFEDSSSFMTAILEETNGGGHGEGNADGRGVRTAVSGAGEFHLHLPITVAHVRRLHKRCTPCDGDTFLLLLGSVLLRYAGVSGGEVEQESGWHAAVPEAVLNEFLKTTSQPAGSRAVHAECFASPLNATLGFFFSAFPDTDQPFGSLGNFFSCRDATTLRRRICAAAATPDGDSILSSDVNFCLECNPPFDHEVISAAFRHILSWLTASEDSQTCSSFFIIIPDSSQSYGVALRKELEESPMCRWNRCLPPSQSRYIHGAQQQQQTAPSFDTPANAHKRERDSSDVVEEHAHSTGTGSPGASTTPLATLSCPTRLIVVQDDKAEARVSGRDIGEAAQRMWRSVSLITQRK